MWSANRQQHRVSIALHHTRCLQPCVESWSRVMLGEKVKPKATKGRGRTTIWSYLKKAWKCLLLICLSWLLVDYQSHYWNVWNVQTRTSKIWKIVTTLAIKDIFRSFRGIFPMILKGARYTSDRKYNMMVASYYWNCGAYRGQNYIPLMAALFIFRYVLRISSTLLLETFCTISSPPNVIKQKI